MCDANEELGVLKEIDKPVHRAILLGKILCPNDHCTITKEFFLKMELLIILGSQLTKENLYVIYVNLHIRLIQNCYKLDKLSI